MGGRLAAALQDPGAYLLPLRLFIGIGWLRAFAEKAADPEWSSGLTLSQFLTEHLHEGSIPFPLYASLVREAFLPGAAALAWVVAAGQLMVGLGLLAGALTRAALLWFRETLPTRVNSPLILRSSGPTPCSGDSAPISTW